MSKFKVGDTIKLEKVDDIDLRKGFKKGDIYSVIRIDTVNKETRIFIKDQNFVYDNQIISFDYKKSNRYKLSQAIKATGFKISDLSLATGNAKTYLTGFTAESRFNSRGDITEERLNSLLTTLAFAERALLDLAPKTVDENPIGNGIMDGADAIKNQYAKDSYDRIIGKIGEIDKNKGLDNVGSISNDLLETNIKETLSTLDSALKANQSDINKSNLNKFLIIFILVVIILAVYFFNC